MSREPQQKRSIDSMDRMLDAGEELLLSGGPASLKLNLIVAKSGASTGSFYARFGDMNGYLEALHKRTLEQIQAELLGIFQKASREDSLVETLAIFLHDVIKLLRKFRAPLFFFAVERTRVSAGRENGANFVLAINRHIIEMLSPFMEHANLPETERRLDMAARIVSAMSFQIVMFDQNEVSSLRLSDRDMASEWATLLSAGLEHGVNK